MKKINKKLVVCSPQLGISSQSNSGGEVYDRETLKYLCDLGVKVIVILPKNKPCFKHQNLIVYYLPISFVWPPYLFNLLILPYLFGILKNHKFNILRVHSPYFVGLGALIFKFFLSSKINLVVHYHHLEDNFLFDLINKLFIKKWDVITADSQFTKNEIVEKYELNKEKIKIIYAGVDKKFKPKMKKDFLLKKYNLKNKKVLLFLGGLKPRKNIGFLLRLMTKIQEENIKLLIVGEGRLKSKLIKIKNKLGLKNKVIFTGFIKEEEKIDYYNLADIFLFPSQKEGFGMPIIEAGSCGIPAIASDVSSLKELIINGKTGYLAKFNDISDWREKIKRLLKDKNLRAKMGQSARGYSQQFSWAISARKQIEIYKKIKTNFN